MRIQVNLLLALSGALSGALVGFALGLVPLPDVTPAVAVAAAVLDALRVPTLAVRRQVPQYWGRIFPPRTVAVLYGARLGVGPLTLLPTWLWWAAMLVGASRGPWIGAAAGATFAIVRTLTMWSAGTRARRIDGADRPIRIAVAAVALVALAACSDSISSGRRASDDDGAAAAPTTDETSAPATIELEPVTTTTTTPEDAALTELLLADALPGFERTRDDLLDLEAAAASEADADAERALLETRGFTRGVARVWSNAHDDVVFLTAYDLGSPDQADLYLVDGAETLTARDAEPFDASEIAGAFGFTTSEEGFVAHAVAFTRGNRWFLVLVGSSDGSRTPAEVLQLAAAQSALVT
jgi:hypothetical protein